MWTAATTCSDNRRHGGRAPLNMDVGLVGWSHIATGRHFPVEVLAGWGLGSSCTALARWLISLAVPAWQTACRISALVWYGVAACIVMVDQFGKLAINHTHAHGEQVEVTPFFNLADIAIALGAALLIVEARNHSATEGAKSSTT